MRCVSGDHGRNLTPLGLLSAPTPASFAVIATKGSPVRLLISSTAIWPDHPVLKLEIERQANFALPSSADKKSQPANQKLDAAPRSGHRGDVQTVARLLRRSGFPSDLNGLAGDAGLAVSKSRFPSQTLSSQQHQRFRAPSAQACECLAGACSCPHRSHSDRSIRSWCLSVAVISAGPQAMS